MWIRSLLLVALLASLPGAFGPQAATPERLRVRSIAMAAEGTATRVELALSRAATYEVFTLTGPHRVVIDMASAALGPTALPLPAPAGAVRQVRVAHRPGGNLRIVLDVTEEVQPFATSGSRDGVPSLELELRSVARPVAADVPAPVTVSPESPAGAKTVETVPAASTAANLAPSPAPVVSPASLPVPAPVTAPAPAASPTVPPVAAAPVAVERPRVAAQDIVVVVDAGHGGHDPGALGPSGVREKDVTLAISRRLVGLLNDVPGMRGVLTRSDDRFLGLRERMERARSSSANLFISIHADAAYNRSAQGSTVYVLSEKAASDEASRRLAARENAALIGGVELGDKDPVLASVLMDLSQNASISSSIAVGDAILSNMTRLGRLHRRTVQMAPFMVLKSPDVPSVLIETAYISNPVDERNLRSPRHQQELARAILDGIQKYFSANPPGSPASRPVITVASVGPARAVATNRPRQHVVRRGETLSGLASYYRVTVRSLRSLNALRSDTVWVGQKLRIPGEAI